MRKREIVVIITALMLMPIGSVSANSPLDLNERFLKEKHIHVAKDIRKRFEGLQYVHLPYQVRLQVAKENDQVSEKYGKIYVNVGRVTQYRGFITTKPGSLRDAKILSKTSEYKDKPLELIKKHTTKHFTSYLFKSGGEIIGWISKEDIEVGQNDIAYILKEGETLKGVSKKYEKTIPYLRIMNRLSENEEPAPGTKLKLVLGITETNNDAYLDDMTKVTKPAESVQDFINRIVDDAIVSQRENRILASVTIAQAILESSNGTSGLAIVGNNLFGIKGAFNGQSVYFPTMEQYSGEWFSVTAAFRKYDSWGESLRDHAALLSQNPRYASVVGQGDYALATMGLQESGYATDPDYATKLNQIIATYGLDKFDIK